MTSTSVWWQASWRTIPKALMNKAKPVVYGNLSGVQTVGAGKLSKRAAGALLFAGLSSPGSQGILLVVIGTLPQWETHEQEVMDALKTLHFSVFDPAEDAYKALVADGGVAFAENVGVALVTNNDQPASGVAGWREVHRRHPRPHKGQ